MSSRRRQCKQQEPLPTRENSSSSDEIPDPFTNIEDSGSDDNYNPEVGDVSSSDTEIFPRTRRANFDTVSYSEGSPNVSVYERSADERDIDQVSNEDQSASNSSTSDAESGAEGENTFRQTPEPNSNDSMSLLHPRSNETQDAGHSSEERHSQSPHIQQDDLWTNTTAEIPDFAFDASSNRPQITPSDKAIDIFNQIFTPNIIQYIVTCTNAYGKKLVSTSRPALRNSRYRVFKEVDDAEMRKFLGLSLLNGHVKVPTQSKLFTKSDPLYYHPIFSYVMSARRYNQILRCINIADLDAKGGHKVTAFMNLLTQRFRDAYSPGKELSLDESLLLFRGRLHFRQYIKSKKARYGIKFYVLATSDGYVLNIFMYSGKDNAFNSVGSKMEKLVLRLMRPYLLKGHDLYMDNYYNSVTLSEKLLDLKTHTNGTLRKNRRDNPKNITEKKIRKGEHVWARKGKIYVSQWRDKRPVIMISTLNHPKLIDTVNRHGKVCVRPEEVEQYNKHMSGVDRSDQMIKYYSTPRKTLRWPKKVFFHLLDTAVWNAFYLYKKLNVLSSSYSYNNYRDAIIRELIQIKADDKAEDLFGTKTKRPGNYVRESRSAEVRPEAQKHWPVRIPSEEGKSKKYKFLNCKVCYKKKIRRETSYRCGGCVDSPALCPTCFEEWHTKLNEN